MSLTTQLTRLTDTKMYPPSASRLVSHHGSHPCVVKASEGRVKRVTPRAKKTADTYRQGDMMAAGEPTAGVNLGVNKKAR